jgi:hypothetical protein
MEHEDSKPVFCVRAPQICISLSEMFHSVCNKLFVCLFMPIFVVDVFVPCSLWRGDLGTWSRHGACAHTLRRFGADSVLAQEWGVSSLHRA